MKYELPSPRIIAHNGAGDGLIRHFNPLSLLAKTHLSSRSPSTGFLLSDPVKVAPSPLLHPFLPARSNPPILQSSHPPILPPSHPPILPDAGKGSVHIKAFDPFLAPPLIVVSPEALSLTCSCPPSERTQELASSSRSRPPSSWCFSHLFLGAASSWPLHFLLSPSISPPVSVAPAFIQVCLCTSIIEQPSRQASAHSLICLFF